MIVSSKELYRQLGQPLNPMMKKSGFKSLRGGRLGWQRTTAKGNLSVWFQCDKWGWNERWGSRFTLQFALSAGPEIGILADRWERIGFLLEGLEIYDELRIRNNAVIERLPGTLCGQLEIGKLSDGSDYVVDGYKIETEKFYEGQDLWLNYYSVADAIDWAEYFKRNLLGFVSMFENEKRSELANNRHQFNRMLGHVQGLPALQYLEKYKLLEEFILSDVHDSFKKAAQNWLEVVKEKYG